MPLPHKCKATNYSKAPAVPPRSVPVFDFSAGHHSSFVGQTIISRGGLSRVSIADRMLAELSSEDCFPAPREQRVQQQHDRWQALHTRQAGLQILSCLPRQQSLRCQGQSAKARCIKDPSDFDNSTQFTTRPNPQHMYSCGGLLRLHQASVPDYT